VFYKWDGKQTFLAELASHPHVLEVSVVARSHSKWGERPMAFVVLHSHHTLTWKGRHDEFSKQLKEFAKTRLPGFACPEWVEIVPELPVSHVMSWLNSPPSLMHQLQRKPLRGKSSSLNYANLWPNFENRYYM
jgi:hypothetical protein